MKIMGILNVTPDSFSDGGAYTNIDSALLKAKAMIAQGAHIIDVGGQSSRPDSLPIPLKTEQARVLPLIHALKKLPCLISLDTYVPEIAEEAIAIGVDIINDISGINTAHIVGKHNKVQMVIMHNRFESGHSPHAKTNPEPYDDVVKSVIRELRQSIQKCCDLGVKPHQIILDPGIGFAKTHSDNVCLLKHLMYIKSELNYPMLLGASRKRVLSTLINADHPNQCDVATIVTSLHAYMAKFDYVRVHDVKSTHEALTVFKAIN